MRPFLFFSGLFLVAGVFFAIAANMDAVNHWAWNDVSGWIDLAGITVGDAAVTGKATSVIGDIYFDCESYPTPPALPLGACSNYPDWKVSNTFAGTLSGYAWNNAIGWVSFWCGNSGGSCASSNYQTTIDVSNGDFSGYAWNDVTGWISFCGNAAGTGNCLTSPVAYQATTLWRPPSAPAASLESSIIDAGSGVTLNSIVWQGNPNGGSVKFQIAAGSSPGSLSAYSGDYSGVSGVSISLASLGSSYVGKQYFRYKIILIADASHTKSPKVDDVIINWSR